MQNWHTNDENMIKKHDTHAHTENNFWNGVGGGLYRGRLPRNESKSNQIKYKYLFWIFYDIFKFLTFSTSLSFHFIYLTVCLVLVKENLIYTKQKIAIVCVHINVLATIFHSLLFSFHVIFLRLFCWRMQNEKIIKKTYNKSFLAQGDMVGW